MSETLLTPSYWESRWQEGQTGWDIGYVSTPLKEYFDQKDEKDLDILIPGCGNAWEGEYLFQSGFKKTHLIDIAPSATEKIKNRVPELPDYQVITGDFFELNRTFDIVVEQTFFCALSPAERPNYARKMHEIIRPGGSLIGVLFDTQFGFDHPPYGGDKDEYLGYFSELFEVKVMERCHNSIEPRQGRELFIHLKRL